MSGAVLKQRQESLLPDREGAGAGWRDMPGEIGLGDAHGMHLQGQIDASSAAPAAIGGGRGGVERGAAFRDGDGGACLRLGWRSVCPYVSKTHIPFLKTTEAARAVFPTGNTCLTLFDPFGSLFADPDFAALFPDDGQPALSLVHLILILQLVETALCQRSLQVGCGS